MNINKYYLYYLYILYYNYFINNLEIKNYKIFI